MADKSIRVRSFNGNEYLELKLVDNLDGTYSLSTSGGGEGGGGGAATIADGADIAQGAKADAAASSSVVEDTTVKTGISLWKGIKNILKLINDKLVGGTVIGDVNIHGTPSVDASVTGTVGIDQSTEHANEVVVKTAPDVTGTVAISTSPIHVDDNSGSLTVDGAVGVDDANGIRLITPTKFVDMAAIAITTIATVWTPASNKKFRLMGGSFSVNAACSVLFEDNAHPGTVIRTPKLAADTPYAFDLGNGILSAAANNVLKATASTGTVTITGHLYGTEE
jgi:hypothetical protein